MRQKQVILISLVVFILMIISSLNLASALTISSVDTTPYQIKPGEDAEVRIVIENDGDRDIEDVSVKLDLVNVPFAPFDSSSEKTIDEIEEDDKQTFRFRVIALNTADSGIYKIPIEITYKEDNEMKTRAGLISLTINDVPELDVQVEEGLFLKGKQNEVTLRIINKGLSDAEFLEVELFSGSYSILTPKKIYIGEIGSDDFDTIDYKIYFNENIADIISLPVILRYKDITNKEFTKNFNVDLRVYSQEEAIRVGLMKKNNTITYIILVIVVLVLWFIYRKIRKVRKARKARQEAGAS